MLTFPFAACFVLPCSKSLLVVQIFAGNVILGHFVRVYFPSVLVVGLFDARHHTGLKRVTFVNQLVNTFRVRAFDVGQSLQISRLPS